MDTVSETREDCLGTKIRNFELEIFDSTAEENSLTNLTIRIYEHVHWHNSRHNYLAIQIILWGLKSCALVKLVAKWSYSTQQNMSDSLMLIKPFERSNYLNLRGKHLSILSLWWIVEKSQIHFLFKGCFSWQNMLGSMNTYWTQKAEGWLSKIFKTEEWGFISLALYMIRNTRILHNC